MYCAAYTDARLAAVYDALNPPSEDIVFYVELAGDSAKTILDMGCGTGRLACSLARLGHRVTGADPAAGMLGMQARRRREGKVDRSGCCRLSGRYALRSHHHDGSRVPGFSR